MKKIIQVLFLITIVCLPIKIKALSVDKNDITISSGSSEFVDLYVTTEEEITNVSFTLTFSTYDLPASLILEDGLTDSTPSFITHNIVFNAPVSGKVKIGKININSVKEPKVVNGTVNLSSPKAITKDSREIRLDSQNIYITIGVPDENPIDDTPVHENNLLDRIESSIVNINLKEDIYEYSVDITDNIKSLDLNAVPKDSNYNVEMSSQVISELIDNTITVKVSNETVTEEYKIKVNVIKNEEVSSKKEDNQTKLNDETESDDVISNYKIRWIVLIVILAMMLYAGILLCRKKK